MQQNKKALAAVIGANFIFGSNYAVVKYITPSMIHPFALNLVRVVVSIVLFGFMLLYKPSNKKIDRKDFPRFILCALTGVVINQIFFIKGLSLTTAIHSSLLSLGTPIFISIIAFWMLKEGFSLIKAAGLALGISGAAILVLSKDHGVSGSNVLLGDLLVLINAISYAFYLVLVRPLMLKYSGIQVLLWIFLIGILGILPLGLNPLLQTNWAAFDPGHFLALGFVAIGATFLAYTLNLYSISAIGASATGAFIYTQPVFAAIIATAFAGEHFTLTKAFSAVLIFAGVYLANFKK